MSELHTIESLDRQPFKHLVATIGNLPTSFVDSMSYYECIAWLVKYLETKVIPAINNNAEATEELQAYYTQLKEYVDNYFDNLDVQEEINNKLDVMAKDGTLEELIDEHILANVKTNIDRIYQNQKFKPVLFESLYAPAAELDMDKAKARILKWKEMGCTGMIPIIHFNTDGQMSLQENLTDIKTLMEYADRKSVV